MPGPEVFIKVDLSEIAASAMARLPSRDDQNRMVQGLGAAAFAFWKKQAQQHLRATSREYVQGLTSESGDRTFTITLDGVLPNLIEQGMTGGDMRQWMLNGPRVKRGKKGRYLTIPFQHGTPGTTGRNVGTPMPASIHEAAKMLSPTLSRHRQGQTGTKAHLKTVKYGERLTEHNSHLKQEARKLLTTKMKPWHHSSVFRGMIRHEKKFAKATQTTGYTTFRTLSENVIRGETDEAGQATQHWFHPGITARHFAQKTQKQVRRIAHHMLATSTSGSR